MIIGDFHDERIKMSKMGLGQLTICPQGRNRAPFRSTINGFRDISNRSFGRVIIGDFRDERLEMSKMGLGQSHIRKLLYDRRFPR